MPKYLRCLLFDGIPAFPVVLDVALLSESVPSMGLYNGMVCRPGLLK